MNLKSRFENSNLVNLKPYALSSQKAWDHLDNPDLLKLDWNESTIRPSPNVNVRLSEYLQNGHLNYYPRTHSETLVEKLGDYCGTPTENILYFASSDSAHEYVLRAFAAAGETLLIVGPTYDNFRVVAQSAGMKINYHELAVADNFAPCTDTLLDAITDDIKVVYICNPNNPSGTHWSPEQVDNILSQRPNTLLVLDEAYFEFGGQSCSKLTLKHDNVIVTRTFSKAFGLAGVRIGYTIAHPSLNNSIQKIRNTKSVGTLSLIAAEAALDDVEYTRAYVKKVLASKNDFMAFLRGIDVAYFGHEPGNFLMIKPPAKQDLIAIGEGKRVFIRDLAHLSHIGDLVRITIGTKDEMVKVKDLIKTVCDNA
jgi:histidinol-phosphate aminotransferase